MKLGIFIDPLATLKAEKDTTLLIIERANALGWECFYFTPADLFFRDNEVYASLASIKITGLKEPKLFMSDHFHIDEEAGGQYNYGDYYHSNFNYFSTIFHH